MNNEPFFRQILAGRIPLPNSTQTLGANIIEVDIELFTITMEFDGSSDFANPVGKIQGGFLAAMLDEVMSASLALTWAANEFAPILGMNVQFFGEATVGTPILGIGKVESRGLEISHSSGELTQSDRLVARATTTAMLRKM